MLCYMLVEGVVVEEDSGGGCGVKAGGGGGFFCLVLPTFFVHPSSSSSCGFVCCRVWRCSSSSFAALVWLRLDRVESFLSAAVVAAWAPGPSSSSLSVPVSSLWATTLFREEEDESEPVRDDLLSGSHPAFPPHVFLPPRNPFPMRRCISNQVTL